MVFKNKNKNKQNGFSILAVILVIVAVIVAIGVWALSGQSNTLISGTGVASVHASSLANDASILKIEYDRILISGNKPYETTDVNSIIYSPNHNFTPNYPNPNSKAVTLNPNFNDEGHWILGYVIGNKIGTSASDPALIIMGVRADVCKEINKGLYGSTNIPPTPIIDSPVDLGGFEPAILDIDISTVSGVSGWMQGCVGTARGVDENMFFRILQAK